MAGLIVLGPAWAQDSSADYQRDYHRQALSIYRDVIAMRTAAGRGTLDNKMGITMLTTTFLRLTSASPSARSIRRSTTGTGS